MRAGSPPSSDYQLTEQAEQSALLIMRGRLGMRAEASPWIWKYASGMNLYEYLVSSPPSQTDPTGQVAPAPIIAGAIITTAACISPFVLTMQARKDWTNDKYAHCVVSCQIAKACGSGMAMLAGYGKELQDDLKLRFRNQGVGWDPNDIIADKDGIACAPKELWNVVGLGPALRWGIGVFGESCDCCCKRKGRHP